MHRVWNLYLIYIIVFCISPPPAVKHSLNCQYASQHFIHYQMYFVYATEAVLHGWHEF